MRQNKRSLSPTEKWTIINDFKQAGFGLHIKTIPGMHRLSVLTKSIVSSENNKEKNLSITPQ